MTTRVSKPTKVTRTTIAYDFPEVPNDLYDEFDKLVSDTNNLYFKLERKGVEDAEKVLMNGTIIDVKYIDSCTDGCTDSYTDSYTGE